MKHDKADVLVLHSTAETNKYTEVQNNLIFFFFLLNKIPLTFFVEREKYLKNIRNLPTDLTRTHAQPSTVLCVLAKAQQLYQHASI